METSSQQLPHLVVDEPKRSLWAMGGIVVLSLMVLAIPIGIFLVQQRTQLTPQAAVSEPVPNLSTGIFLESKLSPESEGGIIPVDVYIRSFSDPINLASVKLKFDPTLLAVDKIATNAAQIQKTGTFSKWLEAGFDNSRGTVTVIAGTPSPGIKSSDLPEGKAYIASLYLRPKKPGTAVIQATSESLLLRNSDNQNVFQSGSDLVLSLASGISQVQNPTPLPISATTPAIVITAPAAASNYSYFKPIEIVWSSFNVEIIPQINLYINGEFFGPIIQNPDAKLGKFTWQPRDSLALPYVQIANTYMIEIVGVGKNGETAKSMTGPFGILGQEEVSGQAPNPEFFNVNPLIIEDASRMFSNYLVVPPSDRSLDFNRDEVINDLDFYLLKQNLLGRGIIR